MPRTISFFIAEDELSNKLLSIVNDLIGRVRDHAKIKHSESIGVATTTVGIKLRSALGEEDFLELKIHVMPGAYAEALKIRYGLPEIPAVKLGDAVRWGEDAVSIASAIHSLLAKIENLTAEQVFYNITSYVRGPVLAESAIKEEAPVIGAVESRRRIQEIVDFLSKGNPDMMGCAVLDEGGAIIACSIPPEMDEEKISTAFSVLKSIVDGGVQQMALEKISQLMIFAEKGGALLHKHKDLFLLVLIKPNARLGAVLMDLKHAIEQLEQAAAKR